MYIYENHLGGFYTNDRYFSDEELYCEECGDSDYCIGRADNRKQAKALLNDYLKGDDTMPDGFIDNFVEQNWKG